MSRLSISINEETSINRAIESNLKVGLVLETPRGKVLTPTKVSSEAELLLLFGESSIRYPVLSMIRYYLRQYSGIMISRIKYQDAVQSECIIADDENTPLIRVIGNSYSSYENDQIMTIKVTDTDNVTIIVEDSDGVIRSTIGQLPSNIVRLVDEYNARSQYYTMELAEGFDDINKEITDTTVTFSGGVTGSIFDEEDVIKALKTFDTVSIPEVNILLAPGLNKSITVVNEGLQVALNRKETIYLADFADDLPYDTMLSNASTMKRSDSLALYYPSVLMQLPIGSSNLGRMYVPASAAALFAWAKASEDSKWACPAGYTSSFKLPSTLDLSIPLSTEQADSMYEATKERPAINPIVYDNTIGFLVDGQRTTQEDTRLNYSLAVSRLIKYIRYTTQEITKPFKYKPNTEFTWDEWTLMMTSELLNLKNSQGIAEFEVKMGEGVTMTKEEVDQGLMRGVIRVRPVFMAEYIDINIGITTEIINVEEENEYGY